MGDIGANIDKYQLQTMEGLKSMQQALDAMANRLGDEQVKKLQNEKHAMEKRYTTQISALEQEIRTIKEEFSSKDALISKQSLQIKELESRQKHARNVDALKNEIMESMTDGFESTRLANK